MIDGETIVAVTAPGAPTHGVTEEIDATGKLVLPGGVDPHCHVGFTSGEFTSLDRYPECTAAALFGATTTIVDFAIPRPGARPLDAAREQLAKIPAGLCDAALHGCVVDWDESVPMQLRHMADAGIRTIKMFTTYAGESMADEHTILNTMRATRDLGGMVLIHCESDAIVVDAQNRCAAIGTVDAGHMADTRPELAETSSVAAILAIAESQQAPVYFVHQSTPDAVDLVVDARKRGVVAFTETVAHHLTLDDSRYAQDDPERFVCCPPLRRRDVVDELGSRLLLGSVTTVGSDHCCYDTRQKQKHQHDVRAMPNGLPGVETRLPVIFSRFVNDLGMSPSRFVEVTATNPAITNGLYPRKGSLLPGSDADIAIWDADREWVVTRAGLHMATDYTPYEGMRLRGRPEQVFLRGELVIADGELVSDVPRGRYVPAAPMDFASIRAI
ncbi:dihydropyrimidinase [Tsukamurella soli]|uniref:Dihydropyrimidinase n=1 Tax=Tsukamurella soli TaxID=644556 RepID=A0ABP8KD34_9ACTN